MEYLSLKDYVYNYIADAISTGELAAEEKINENVICEELNISRTPVREALIQLSAQGYLENSPRKGFIVRHVTLAEAKESYSIIGVMDGLAASLACGRLTEKDLKNMEFFTSSLELAIQTGNFEMYYKEQEEFHDIYMRVCGNETLREMIRQMKKKFLRKTYIGEKEEITNALLATNEEHKTIVKLFWEGDSEAVERYVRNTHWHLDQAYWEII